MGFLGLNFGGSAEKKPDSETVKLDAVIAGPAKPVIDAFRQLHETTKSTYKSYSLGDRWGGEGVGFYTKFIEGYARRYDGGGYEKKFYLGSQNYGDAMILTIRDNGTMALKHQKQEYDGFNAKGQPDLKCLLQQPAYNGPISLAAAQPMLDAYIPTIRADYEARESGARRRAASDKPSCPQP